MSNFSTGDGSSDHGQSGNLQSLLAQFRRQQGPESPAPEPVQRPPALLSHFNSYGQGNQSFYDASNPDSPVVNNNLHNLFPPAAPTPPVQGFQSSQYPPGMMSGRNRSDLGLNQESRSNDMSANLLSLLKFGGSNQQPNQQAPAQQAPREQLHFKSPPATAPVPIPSVIHAPAPSSADPTGLLAALIKGHLPNEPAKNEPRPDPQPEPQQASASWSTGPPPDSTQQYLLNLLNRPKPSQNDVPATSELQKTEERGGNNSFKTENLSPSFDNASHDSTAKASFGYNTNPFEDFSGSSPARRHTPKSSNEPTSRNGTITSQTGQTTLPIQILKKPGSALSNHSNQSQPHHMKRVLSDRSFSSVNSPETRKIDHASPLSHVSHHAANMSNEAYKDVHERPKESVQDAMSELAEKADQEAQDAIARAEEEMVRSKAEEQEEIEQEIDQELENLMNAKTDEEFAKAAQIAADTIQREFNKEETQNAMDNVLDHDVAQNIKNMVAGTADMIQSLQDEQTGEAAAVADSWESAEADEIIVIEEKPDPVKVYNFPMKPWITITVQETNEERAVFSDEAILDIARLKKDFDQIDRNLVGVSEAYLAYGMSKAGGFRVVRQMDGKDARMFTDTKDRIFNVSVSSADAKAPSREAVICTGVSGTVYWVQLKAGDRDHVDDAHPEQYGFALPPISTQDGDAPGGVLKTRARASCSHPEFFAVGRGKSIHVVWPSFIFHHSLFKAGHDRVVDTERLLKQCSLKINTGKAGKDFTFAPDDTVLVSLDKSGRVKFWDVRDLTATDPNSDPSNPLPAQTSLEVKEPLLTLTTTPEGEKAWPTSVLLLDKFRPYQRRTALRYMIVGMKQNHTLQLWDLALGKCVQEFHFPHNKESDAVCSVLYHAPTSMIVVGHPTRNSIYFLHLSAPKYGLNRISQVDYVQRLAAADPSIPQPEATAVISGVREYSFANKGILRSLTILENPAAHSDEHESVLFELYAMHSKGVTCLAVKKHELGWDNDNKVILSVDAEKIGYVKITKLPETVAPPREPEPETTPQIRIATRQAKELLQKTPSSQGEKKDLPSMSFLDTQTPVKVLARDDVDSTPVHAPSQKPESRRRKKKQTASSEAQSERTDNNVNSNLNGATELSRLPSQTKNSRNNRHTFDPLAEEPNAMDRGTASTGTASFVPSGSIDLISELAKMGGTVAAQLEGPIREGLKEIAQQSLELENKNHQDFQVNYAVLLDRVQKTLTENIDAMLAQIVKENFDKMVLPYMSDQYYKINASVNAALTKSLRQDVQHAMPGAVNQALQHPEVLKPYSDRIAGEVKAHLDAQTLKSTNMAISNLLPKSFAKFEGEFNRKIEDKLSEHQRSQDAKIGQLTDQIKNLAMSVSAVTEAQTQMQQDMAAIKQLLVQQSGQLVQQQQASPAVSHAHSHLTRESSHREQPRAILSHGAHLSQSERYRPVQECQQPQESRITRYQDPGLSGSQIIRQPMSADDREREELERRVAKVSQMMMNGEFKESILELMGTPQPQNETVYQRAIAPFGPDFLTKINDPLVLLSAAHSISLLTDRPSLLNDKLAFLDHALHLLYQRLPELSAEVRAVMPDIIPVIKQQLEKVFSYISSVAPQDSSLKRIKNMAAYADRILEDSPQINYGAHY